MDKKGRIEKGEHLSVATQFKKGHYIPYWKGRKLSSEHKKHIGESGIGRIVSLQTKKKISVAHIGLKHSEEAKKKMSFAKKGANHPRWKGGICKDIIYLNWLKNGRNRVLKRIRVQSGRHTWEEWLKLKALHGYLCVNCGESEFNSKLTIDHIIPLSKNGIDLISNIQPLCHSCNSRKSNKIISYVN